MLPLFPLNSVLYPGGSLPLRVFETRYMDMVKDCISSGKSFGVCLITQGQEVGAPASHEDVGCEAVLKDWDMEQLGILQIRVVGTRRFRVRSSQVRASGLIEAEVDYLPDETPMVLPEEYVALAALSQRIVNDLGQKRPKPIQKMVEEPYEYASANWVGRRLCEFLPIPNPIKHRLMVLDDPLGRLQLVQHYLKQQGIL